MPFSALLTNSKLAKGMVCVIWVEHQIQIGIQSYIFIFWTINKRIETHTHPSSPITKTLPSVDNVKSVLERSVPYVYSLNYVSFRFQVIFFS